MILEYCWPLWRPRHIENSVWVHSNSMWRGRQRGQQYSSPRDYFSVFRQIDVLSFIWRYFPDYKPSFLSNQSLYMPIFEQLKPRSDQLGSWRDHLGYYNFDSPGTHSRLSQDHPKDRNSKTRLHCEKYGFVKEVRKKFRKNWNPTFTETNVLKLLSKVFKLIHRNRPLIGCWFLSSDLIG